eukprot:6180774-Pleurochrysis_carterae.AAC.1
MSDKSWLQPIHRASLGDDGIPVRSSRTCLAKSARTPLARMRLRRSLHTLIHARDVSSPFAQMHA